MILKYSIYKQTRNIKTNNTFTITMLEITLNIRIAMGTVTCQFDLTKHNVNLTQIR